jgi:hypothetical protein
MQCPRQFMTALWLLPPRRADAHANSTATQNSRRRQLRVCTASALRSEQAPSASSQAQSSSTRSTHTTAAANTANTL